MCTNPRCCVLLEQGRSALLNDIAHALLRYDQSQVEYYGLCTKNMVVRVLTANGVVQPIKSGRQITGYDLTPAALTGGDRHELLVLCERWPAKFLDERGAHIWQHRSGAEGYVLGSVSYEVRKRAKYRCELYWADQDQAALHIDHIIPRSKGGSDYMSNCQSLCVTSNTSKRDRDDTDFRAVLASYN